MGNHQALYLKVICNFFNNYCGYMEDTEIKELINIIFNCEVELTDERFEKFVDEVNDCIVVDDGDKLVKLFEEIKNN